MQSLRVKENKKKQRNDMGAINLTQQRDTNGNNEK